LPEKIQTINLFDHKAFKSVFFQGGRLQEYFHISKPTTMKKPNLKAFGGVRILTHLLTLLRNTKLFEYDYDVSIKLVI